MKLRYRLILIVVGLFLFVQVVNADITYNPSTNTIIVTGTNGGNSWTFEDIYQADVANGWGKVTKEGSYTYIFDCKLRIGDKTTYTEFEDSNKLIVFKSGIITNKGQKLIEINENATINISLTTFSDFNSNYWHYFVYNRNSDHTKAYFYSCSFSSPITARVYNVKLEFCTFQNRVVSYFSETINSVLFGYSYPLFPDPVKDCINTIVSCYQSDVSIIRFETSSVNEANIYNPILISENESNTYYIYSKNSYYIKKIYNLEYNFNLMFKWYGDVSELYNKGAVELYFLFDPHIINENGNPLSEVVVKIYKDEELYTTSHTNENGKLVDEIYLMYLRAKVDPNEPDYTITNKTIYEYPTWKIILEKDGYRTLTLYPTINKKFENEITLQKMSFSTEENIQNVFKNNYIYILAISIFIFLISKFTRTSFIALVAGIWLLILAVYTFQYGTPAFKDYSTIFAAIPLVLGVYMVIDGALGIIYD